jgi:hypothetical protein
MFVQNGQDSVPVTLERFVSADEAAGFLSVKRRYLLHLARKGIAGAYPLGSGRKRKTWIFHLSELSAAIARGDTSIRKIQEVCDPAIGSPR